MRVTKQCERKPSFYPPRQCKYGGSYSHPPPSKICKREARGLHRIKVGIGGESEVMSVAEGKRHDIVNVRHGEMKGNVETKKKKHAFV